MEVSGDWANAKPMLGLVAQQAYNKLAPGKTIELNLSKGLFVVSLLIYSIYFFYPIYYISFLVLYNKPPYLGLILISDTAFTI